MKVTATVIAKENGKPDRKGKLPIFLKYREANGQERSLRVPPWEAGKVEGVKAGDAVEIDLVKNGDYWNLEAIKVTGTAPAATASSGNTREDYWTKKDQREAIQIPRSVALKAAIDFVTATKKHAEVEDWTDRFFNYLTTGAFDEKTADAEPLPEVPDAV